MKLFLLVIGATFALAYAKPAARAQSDEFYSGKTVRIIVGYASGGGHDFYARRRRSTFYKLVKPDGLTLGHFSGSLFPLQAMGQKEITFDARRFEHVGGVAKVEIACGFAKSSGIDSVEKWMAQKTAPRMPATAPGTGGHDTSRLLHATLGVPMQLVLGYKSTGEMRLALERGEVHGICNGWEIFPSLWKKSIASGDMILILQALPKPHADLPKVPLAIDYAKTEEARQLIQLGAHDVSAIARPFVLPPGTPNDRVQIRRKAFTATMSDPDFSPMPTRPISTLVRSRAKNWKKPSMEFSRPRRRSWPS
jgi:tripartite-type tricarboxylate transporter receptor subunit TctC